jgi:hypothetical protein
MARRSYGSGRLWSVKRKKGEVWYASWWAGPVRVKRKLGPKRSPGSSDGLTRAEAERELRRRVERDVVVARPARRTLQQAGEEYIDHLETVMERKRTTIQDYRGYLRGHLAPYFGDRGIGKIDADRVAGAFSPDGCAIAFRGPAVINGAWRIAPEDFHPEAVQRQIHEEPPHGFRPLHERLADRYSGRSILAEITVEGETAVVASFHATPGTGTVGGRDVGEWKPFFHGGVAVALGDLKTPFVFAIDANEPYSESIDSVTFHWAEGDSGVKKLRALLGMEGERIHRGRDLFREWLTAEGGDAASADVLLPTYAPNADFHRRFDSMWATPEFRLARFETLLDEVMESGGDHAMLVADLRLG